MKRFEYHIYTIASNLGWPAGGGKVDTSEMGEDINALGAEGWELTSAFDTNRTGGGSRDVILIFKRERQD